MPYPKAQSTGAPNIARHPGTPLGLPLPPLPSAAIWGPNLTTSPAGARSSMAFSDESKSKPCGREGCCNRRPYFKMIESRRDQDAYMGEGIDGEQVTRFRRICEVCEHQSRTAEYYDLPARFREKYPNYCDEKAVHKTIRCRAKGDSWRMFPKNVKAAKKAINERRAKGATEAADSGDIMEGTNIFQS